MKPARRSGQFVFILLMAFFMSATVSLALTFIRSGYTPGFITLWLRSWTIAFAVAFPTGLIVLPLVRIVIDTLSR